MLQILGGAMFACFNMPSHKDSTGRVYGGVDSRLKKFLLKAFECATKKSEVWGLMYHWNDSNFTSLIKTVHDSRDLKLHAVTGSEGYAGDPDTYTLLRHMNDSRAYDVDPNGLMNHNKFFVFESLDLAQFAAECPDYVFGEGGNTCQPALYISSANLTGGTDSDPGDDGKHNVGVIVPLTGTMFEVFVDYYKKVRSGYGHPGREADNEYQTAKSDVLKAYFYPKRPYDADEDTVVQVLRNLKHYDGSSSDACTVRIVTPRWSDDRVAVAEAIERLYSHGVNIEVVCRAEDNESDTDGDGVMTADLGSEIEAILRRCTTRYYQYGPAVDGSAYETNIHTKYMTIAGPYVDGSSHTYQELVWTGSPNLTKAAVSSHWETMIKLYPKTEAYKAFSLNFAYLRNNATEVARLPGEG